MANTKRITMQISPTDLARADARATDVTRVRGSVSCSEPTLVLSAGRTVDELSSVWSASTVDDGASTHLAGAPVSGERTRVSDARPWVPAPVDLPPLLPLPTRAALDAYVRAVTLLTEAGEDSSEAMRMADAASCALYM